ncbi:MAG TPA: ribosome small subunit-dependent GTPase A, partial [Myxococcaceae bacterium]|nr:ribosome small subunit-dependent GTPase A [Myxococcaceae bacterium]
LNKADACPHVQAALTEIAAVTSGVEVLVGSALSGEGAEALRQRLPPRKTVLLLGASGVGKSSWVNLLLGEQALSTAEVRASDHKGRHTTTHRELRRLPNGSLLVDVPGVRELGLWAGEAEGLSEAFADIAELARGCRFNNCTHGMEPGCAVREAVKQGVLSEERVESHGKLQRELDRLDARMNTQSAQARKQRERVLTVAAWTHSRKKKGGDG